MFSRCLHCTIQSIRKRSWLPTVAFSLHTNNISKANNHKQIKNTLQAMMDLIDGDIAKNIWSFFLEFDNDDQNDPPWSTAKKSLSIASALDRSVDFQSIRSLRCVNKNFYTAFEETSGWSRCALAIKNEYRNLKNDEKFFDNWSFVFRLQTLRPTNHLPPLGQDYDNANDTRSNNWTSREERRQVVKFISRAMERKKVSVYRCNQLTRMLDRGPFSKDEKALTENYLLVAQ